MYDVVIVGGGLAGLYTALHLSNNTFKNIVVIERESHHGGRVYTYHDKFMTVEAGAGRFSLSHRLLMRLIGELGLQHEVTPLPEHAPLYLGKHADDSTMDVILKKLLARNSDAEDLIEMNISNYAKEKLTKKEFSFLESFFGYFAELKIMNAKDALELFKSYKQQFFVLRGGLSQIVKKMVDILKHRGVEFAQETVNHIDYGSDGVFRLASTARAFHSPRCVMAIQRPDLMKIPFFRTLRPALNYIETAPLCRIYSVTTPLQIPVVYANNDLRMIIPVAQNVVMTSYTDSKFAKRWKHLYDAEKEEGINRKLHKDLAEVGIDMPLANTKVFYWDHGVGYWGIGADSKALARFLQQPFEGMNLFLCGENYSSRYQQWMEGALETAEKVVTKILKTT